MGGWKQTADCILFFSVLDNSSCAAVLLESEGEKYETFKC